MPEHTDGVAIRTEEPLLIEGRSHAYRRWWVREDEVGLSAQENLEIQRTITIDPQGDIYRAKSGARHRVNSLADQHLVNAIYSEYRQLYRIHKDYTATPATNWAFSVFVDNSRLVCNTLLMEAMARPSLDEEIEHLIIGWRRAKTYFQPARYNGARDLPVGYKFEDGLWRASEAQMDLTSF